MSPSGQQGMSPTPTATRDGEVSGPNYAAAPAPPGLTVQDVDQGAEPVVNGAGPEFLSSTAAANDVVFSQPSGSVGTVGAAEFLSA